MAHGRGRSRRASSSCASWATPATTPAPTRCPSPFRPPECCPPPRALRCASRPQCCQCTQPRPPKRPNRLRGCRHSRSGRCSGRPRAGSPRPASRPRAGRGGRALASPHARSPGSAPTHRICRPVPLRRRRCPWPCRCRGWRMPLRTSTPPRTGRRAGRQSTVLAWTTLSRSCPGGYRPSSSPRASGARNSPLCRRKSPSCPRRPPSRGGPPGSRSPVRAGRPRRRRRSPSRCRASPPCTPRWTGSSR
mmetsp:Transcript_29095/g.86524  ORF Transcript_29095/g.86524 Transcript_29095/m.86524 type:complete len:248 (-) Transcript_29095:347-1090(-)